VAGFINFVIRAEIRNIQAPFPSQDQAYRTTTIYSLIECVDRVVCGTGSCCYKESCTPDSKPDRNNFRTYPHLSFAYFSICRYSAGSSIHKIHQPEAGATWYSGCAVCHFKKEWGDQPAQPVFFHNNFCPDGWFWGECWTGGPYSGYRCGGWFQYRTIFPYEL